MTTQHQYGQGIIHAVVSVSKEPLGTVARLGMACQYGVSALALHTCLEAACVGGGVAAVPAVGASVSSSDTGASATPVAASGDAAGSMSSDPSSAPSSSESPASGASQGLAAREEASSVNQRQRDRRCCLSTQVWRPKRGARHATRSASTASQQSKRQHLELGMHCSVKHSPGPGAAAELSSSSACSMYHKLTSV
jgi:hypothetical protein